MRNTTHDPGTHSKSKKGLTLPGRMRLQRPRMLHVDAEAHAMTERPTSAACAASPLFGLTPDVHPTSSRRPFERFDIGRCINDKSNMIVGVMQVPADVQLE